MLFAIFTIRFNYSILYFVILAQFVQYSQSWYSRPSQPTYVNCDAGYYNACCGQWQTHTCEPCPAGYSNPESGVWMLQKCQLHACASGTYSEAGSATCTPCPGNGNSPPMATSVDQCESAAVYTHMNEQSFAAFAQHKIEFCPSHMTSLTSISSLSDCVCEPGLYWHNEVCTWCSANTYKATAGNEACTSCPENTVSIPGARTLEQCLCNKGYFFDSQTNVCQPCAAGTYKNNIGNNVCQVCGDLKTSAPAAEFCHCKPGYELNSQQMCTACAPGHYKLLASHEPCQLCEPDTYSSQYGAINCSSCPPGATAEQYGQIACKCPTGKSMVHGVCTSCPANNYCPNSIEQYSCPLNAISSPDSSSISSCTCIAGFYMENQICKICPPNHYCPAASTNPTRCPDNSFSLPKSSSESDCQCVPGFDHT